MAHSLLFASILFVGLADLWLAFPEIDLAISGLFSAADGGFDARGQPWEQIIYGSIDKLLVAVGLGLIGAWAVGRRRRTAAPLVTGRKLTMLLLLLALVPGLVVNLVLKEHWGRARPVQVEQFGGNRQFTPAFVISDQRGGSFSSGHVAAAAWILAVAVSLFGGRSPWTAAAALYLLSMVLARIAAGGHFLSDALTSVLLVWIGYLLLQRWIPTTPSQPYAPPATGE